jgi:hypothetical protein
LNPAGDCIPRPDLPSGKVSGPELHRVDAGLPELFIEMCTPRSTWLSSGIRKLFDRHPIPSASFAQGSISKPSEQVRKKYTHTNCAMLAHEGVWDPATNKMQQSCDIKSFDF